MSSNNLIEKLSEYYPQTEVRQLIKCLRMDPLIWQSVNSLSFSESFFTLAAQDPRYWSPGYLALNHLIPKDEISLNISDHIEKLDEALIDKIQIAYEAFRVTGIPPESLEKAGLVALSIARYKFFNNNWQGISKLLQSKRKLSDRSSLYMQWESVFACLPFITGNYADFCITLIKESPEKLVSQIIQLIQHGVLTQFKAIGSRQDLFLEIFGNQNTNIQLTFLQGLHESGDTETMRLMANAFIKSHENLETIEAIYSQTANENEVSVDNQLITNLSTQSKLLFFAGLPEKSSEFQAKVVELQKKNLARQYHHLAIESAVTNPPLAKSAFANALRYNDNADDIKLDYLQFLAKNQDSDETLKLLNQIDDKSTGRFIIFAYFPDLLNEQNLDITEVILGFYNRGSTNHAIKLIALKRTLDHLLSIGQVSTAKKIIESLMTEFPNDPSVINEAIRVETYEGKNQDALRHAELLQLFDPENEQIHRILVSLYSDTRQWQKAFTLQDRLITKTSSPAHDDLLKFATLAIETDQADLAISICNNLLSQDKLDGEALVVLGNAFIRSGNTKAAIEHMEKAAALAPESPASWLALANIWTHMGDHTKALDTLLKAKSALPDNFNILRELGNAYLDNNLASNALVILKQAFNINPEDMAIRVNLANAHLTLGQLDEAFELLNPIKTAFPQNRQLALVTGKVILAQENYTDAYPYLKFAFDSEKSSETVIPYATLLIKLINTKSNLLNPEKISDEINFIEETLNNLICEEFDTFELMLLSADLKLAKGESQKAYNDYLSLANSQAAKSSINYARVQHGIGLSALAGENFQVSLAALQEAVLSKPTDPTLRHALANAYYQSGMIEEAKDCANSAIKVAPDNISNLLWYSEFSKLINAVDSAIIHLQKATIHFPDDNKLKIALADMFLSIKRPEKAISIVNHLLESNTISNDDIRKVMDILFTLNQGEKAKTILFDALSPDNMSFPLLQDLVDHLIGSGEILSAMEAISKFAPFYGNEEKFRILKIDVLAASHSFDEALQELAPIIKMISSGKRISLQSHSEDDCIDFETRYSDESILCREIGLHILQNNWIAARERTEDSLTIYPKSTSLAYLYLSILFSLLDWDNFTDYYSLIKSEPCLIRLNSKKFDILNWMRFEIAFNEHKLELCNELIGSYNNEKTSNIFLLASSSRLEVNSKNFDQAITLFDNAYEILQNRSVKNMSDLMLNIYDIDAIWSPFALASAAKDLMKWDVANELCAISTRLLPVNPVVNFLYTEILFYTRMAQSRDRSLLIYTHLPKIDTSSSAFSDLLSEQFSNVERASNPSRLDSLSIKVKALSGYEIENAELVNHICSINDAIAFLPLCMNIESASRIKKAFKDDFNVEFGFAVHLFKTQPEKCQQLLPELFNKDTSYPPLHFLQAMCFQEDLALSKQAIENAINQWPNEPYWHAELAKIELKNNRFESASKHLEVAIDLLPDEPDFWQSLGDVKQKEKDFEAAKSYFAHAIDIFPNNPSALFSLAIMNRKLGDFTSAISCLEKAQVLDPSNQIIIFKLAFVYFEAGAYEKAIQLTEKLIDQYPAEIAPRITYLRTLIANNQVEKALIKFTEWKKAFPNHAEMGLIEAQITRLQKSNTDALSLLSDLANKHPEDVETVLAYADSLIKENYFDEAEKTLQQALSIDPENVNFYLSLGRLKKLKGQLDQAVSMFSKSISLDPGIESAYIDLGKSYQERREHQQALKVYEQGIEIFDNSPTLCYLAGIAFKECKDYKNSEKLLRKAAQLDPNDTSIRRQLAGVITMNLVHSLQESK